MEEINIKDLGIFLFRKIKVLVVCFLVFCIVGIIYINKSNNKYYVSSSKIMLSLDYSLKSNEKTVYTNEELISTYKDIAKSKIVLEKVIKELDLNLSYNALANSISLSSKEKNLIIEMSVKSNKKNMSIKIANSVMDNLIETSEELNVKNKLTILEQASSEALVQSVNSRKTMTVFVMLSIVAGIGIIMIMYFFDDKIRNLSDIEKKFKIDVLGNIRLEKKESDDDIKKIALYVENILKNSVRKIISITSYDELENKKYVSLLLSKSISQNGKKVLVVNFDNTNDHLYKKLNISSVFEIKKLELDTVKKINNNDNLSVLAVRNDDLSEEKMVDILKEMSKNCDYVIIISDTLNKSNSLTMSKLSDKTLLVAKLNYTKNDDICDSIKTLNKIEREISGIIVNEE